MQKSFTQYKFRTIDKDYPLILASSSPRRRDLLKTARIPFRSLKSHIDEEELQLGPADMTINFATKKARSIYHRLNDGWILGADTIVLIDNRILGKPNSKANARDMLSTLSNRWHKVITGICILNPHGDISHQGAVTSDVKIKALTRDEIDRYIKTGEPMDKAGAYGIQGIGAFMVEAIKGSYSNVVGLPIHSLIKALIDVGALRHYPL